MQTIHLSKTPGPQDPVCDVCGLAIEHIADGAGDTSRHKRKASPQANLIKLLIYAAGSSPSAVAKAMKVSPAAVTQVLQGKTTSARIQRYIEEITGRPWPRNWAA